MNGSIAKPQIPGLIRLLCMIANVVTSPPSIVVRGIARHRLTLAIYVNNLVFIVTISVVGIVRTIPNILVIPISSPTGVYSCMPLAYLSRAIAVLSKSRGPERAQHGVICTTWIGTFLAH
jgi:hypothetical protein